MLALDVNHDGVIDAGEIANAPAALKTLDKNDDGKLTQDELRPSRPAKRDGSAASVDQGLPPSPLMLALDASVRDSRTGLVIHYPKSWHIDRDSSFFAIESFPAKERPPQLLVPVGGAYIVISMQRVHSIEEWLEADGLTKDNGYRFEEAQLQTQRGTVPAGRITLDHDRVIPEGHMLIHGFFVGDRMYKVFLFYRGAPYEAQYEEIYYDLVRALQFPQ